MSEEAKDSDREVRISAGCAQVAATNCTQHGHVVTEMSVVQTATSEGKHNVAVPPTTNNITAAGHVLV
jgi:hypothetical protein